MEPTGGDLARHDHEFDEVRWFDLADAGGILTFETERALVERAAERVAGRRCREAWASARSDRAADRGRRHRRLGQAHPAASSATARSAPG